MTNKYTIAWTGDPYQTDLLAVPQAPSNWKDTKKIEEFVYNKMRERDQLAAFIPIVSRLHEIVILDEKGKVVVNSTGSDANEFAEPAKEFLSFFLEKPLDSRFYGFNVKPAFRIAALQLMALGKGDAIPENFWYHVDNAYDPYEMLVQNDSRKDVDLYALCEHLHVECVIGDTAARAKTAYDICVKAGIITV